MATVTRENLKSIWTVKEYTPDIIKSGLVEDEISKLESSVALIETQIKLAKNAQDLKYFNNLLVYTNYAICALKYQNLY